MFLVFYYTPDILKFNWSRISFLQQTESFVNLIIVKNHKKIFIEQTDKSIQIMMLKKYIFSVFLNIQKQINKDCVCNSVSESTHMTLFFSCLNI